MEDIMNRISQRLALAIVVIVAFVWTLGIVGSYDYASEVVQSMSDVDYETIVRKIGSSDERLIADEYMNNRAYYDSLNW